MPRGTPQLAKLARPIAEGLIERTRLFAALDRACRQRSVWVTAPAGAGKTSLVSSYLDNRELPCLWYQVDAGDADLATFFHYLGRAARTLSPRKRSLPSLTPEYLPGLETFVRRFFQSLFERLAPPFVLVLDNLHEAPAASPLHVALATAMNEIPPGNTVLFVSRHDPPAPLAHSYANSAVIDWEDLKLTEEETMAFALQHGCEDRAALQPLAKAAQGWAAGLVLLLRAQAAGGTTSLAEIQPPQVLYDYFAQEVFTTIPSGNQHVLLKTAFLPDVTAEAARQLTGSRRAPEVLAELHRGRFFIDRHSRSAAMYVYHPLFRNFLLERATQIYAPPRLTRLKRRAAQVLEQSGQIEAAIELLVETGGWDEAARLTLQQAPALIEQGRNATLDDWIESVPAFHRDGEPGLLYWRGVSRIPFSPPESRLSLEPAFALFKARDDVTGMYLALGAVLSSYFFEWGDFTPVDRWIEELEELLVHHPEFPSIEVEAQVAKGMMALVMRCPQHLLIKKFKERALPLLRLFTEPRQKYAIASPAILYCLWSGDFTHMGLIFAELKTTLDTRRLPPLDAITIKIMEAIHAWLRAAHAEAFGMLVDAGEMARISGVHILDHQIYAQTSWAALSAGDLTLAMQAATNAKAALHPNRRADVVASRLLEYGLTLTQGNILGSTLDAVREVIEETQKIATPFFQAEARLLYGQMLGEVGEPAAARREFAWLNRFAEDMPSPYVQFRTLIVEADVNFLVGEEAEGLASLRQALVIGHGHGFINCHRFWRPKVMARLFARALEADIEVEYVRHFIRVRDLKAPSPDVQHWPWPIKIHALGCFSVLLDDQPLYFQGKAQKKPLELLKCLIAHGGRGVSQGTLIDQLWPNLEGDAGRNAYDVALHRLRKLLKRQDALEVQEGRLALNANEVWVDAWAFERLCGTTEATTDKNAEMAAAQSLLRLYPGHFLEGEDAPWTLAYRERLNSKFQRSVVSLAGRLEHADAWEDVTALYRQAIELDPLAEEFHRGLMRSFRAQGRIAEALDAYRHCRDMLSIVLGIKPSQQTQAMYRSLKSS